MKKETVRLQKFLSECGVASRRASEELILAGKVKVNERIIKELGTQVDPYKDVIRVRNKIVRPAEKGIMLFHKPKEVITSLSDPEGRRCISDYLTKHYRSYYPVGRLDYDSTGLVVLTNDGEIAEKLLHPRYGFERTYEVKVSGKVSPKTAERIAKGILLEDGMVRARVQIKSVDNDSSWLDIVITEGRNRIIRRLLEKLHHPVQKLRRLAHGPLQLGKIRPGDVKPLTQEEYEKVRKKILNFKPSNDVLTESEEYEKPKSFFGKTKKTFSVSKDKEVEKSPRRRGH